MAAALVLKDWWCAVKQDATYQAQTAEEKAISDKKGIALMQVKIISELKHLIKGATTAKSAWDALENTFKAQSVGRKAVLRQMLKEVKRRKSEDVLVYVSRAEILRAELKDACNEDIPDDAFIHYIMDGLGNAYIAFVRQYRYGNEVLTLQELKNRLLHVEMTVQM